MAKLTSDMLVYAKDGDEFWVPVQYPSGIWRVQKLVAGANGVFTRYTDTWIHHGTGHRAYLDRASAVADAQYRLRVGHNEVFKEMMRIKRHYTNLTKFILDNYEKCKEER